MYPSPHPLPLAQLPTKFTTSFSIFMLLGLLTTIRMLPSSETNPDTTVKTLEQWAFGRPIPNTFATHPLSLFIAKNYYFLVRISLSIYLAIDTIFGGDEKERREELKKQKEETEMEMRQIEELERRPGSFRDVEGEGERGRGPSPFVNGRVDGN
jgi:PHS family inorganic phosphate transporter-like MFS transporter